MPAERQTAQGAIPDLAAVGGLSASAASEALAQRSIIPKHEPFSATAANGKRFLERWLADARFRKALSEAPEDAASAFGLKTSADSVRYIWDDAYRDGAARTPLAELIAQSSPAARQMFAWLQRNGDHKRRLRTESRPTHPAFAAWRDRQIARSQTSFREAYDQNTPHIAYAIELSRGCSVGCWFCGVSAPRLGDVFARTPQNAQLLREVLAALKARVGPGAARHGFLYWATDPFDNPDYEAFCADFESVCGVFPITTTALPLRDPQRTAALLDLAAEKGAAVRFSISTLRQLDELHRAFSPEALGGVDIIPLNKGSLLQPSASGRAVERLSRQSAEAAYDQAGNLTRDQTISCVSGFLINMVERSVKLITPCNSSERWPLGYYVYDQATFETAADFASLLDRMILRHMPMRLDAQAVVRFRRDMDYGETADGFYLRAQYGSHSFTGNPLMSEVAAAVAAGDATPAAIAESFGQTYGLDPVIALDWLEAFFQAGLLDEEPKAA